MVAVMNDSVDVSGPPPALSKFVTLSSSALDQRSVSRPLAPLIPRRDPIIDLSRLDPRHVWPPTSAATFESIPHRIFSVPSRLNPCRSLPRPRFMVPSLDCRVVEVEHPLVVDDRHIVNVVIVVGFQRCLVVRLVVCLFVVRIWIWSWMCHCLLEYGNWILHWNMNVLWILSSSWLPRISHRISHLASRISSFVLFVSLSRRRVASHLASRLVRLVTRLVPRRFVPRPRRYLVISLSRCRPDNVFVFFFTVPPPPLSSYLRIFFSRMVEFKEGRSAYSALRSGLRAPLLAVP
jgi:hypothetical protein